MESSKVTKNKIRVLIITVLIFLISVAGISYAYFSIQVTGNETASSVRVSTAKLSLVYNDVQIASGRNVYPGWSTTKTLTVYNNGTDIVDYIIKWRELVNTIVNGELAISATCTSSINGNTCSNIPETVVPSATSQLTNAYVYGPISIEPGETHTYQLTVTFKEMDANQDYNQGKSVNGTLNIGDGTATNESMFNYTIANNEVTIKSYKTTNVEIVDQESCESTGAVLLEQGYNMPSEDATYAAQVLCSGGEVDGLTLADSVRRGMVTSEYYDALGLSVTSLNVPSDIIIPSTIEGMPVTKIDEYAFSGSGLTSVVIPNTVEVIGKHAFENNQLTSLIIPSSVHEIGWCAFENNSITSIAIPSSMTYVDESIFQNNQLVSVSFPNTFTSMYYGAFLGNQLTTVILPESLTYIGYSAFSNNQIKTVTIPRNVTTIDSSAFDYNQLESVIIMGKSSSDDFYSEYSYGNYGDSLWGWKNGVSCVTNNTSNVPNGCITWKVRIGLATDNGNNGLSTGDIVKIYKSAIPDQEFYVINTNETKTTLLAKYNLNVGRTYNGSSYSIIYNSYNNPYGIQSENAKGIATTPAVGVVPFCGSNNSYGYWWDTANNTFKSQYGSSLNQNSVYDTNYVTAPNYSASFVSASGNANYSIAYYVEEYIDMLGVNGVGRLLTYGEYSTLPFSIISNGAYYWLGSASYADPIYAMPSGSDDAAAFSRSDIAGVRPVIEINTSDIEINY